MPSNTRLRYATITWHDVEQRPALDDRMQYLVYQVEKCPTTGKLHLQMYVQYKNPTAFSSVQKDFPGAHIELAKGTPDDNRRYCTKDETRVDGPWELGEMKTQGKRNDLDAAVATLKEHGIKRVAEDHPVVFVKFHKGLDALAKLSRPDPPALDGELDNYWIWGPPGIGKSKYARERFPGAYVKEPTKWWDFYDDEETVIFDDVDPDVTAHQTRFWKVITDRYPLTVEVKCGSIKIRPRRIVVTSNHPLGACFPNPVDHEAMKRRFKVLPMLHKDDIRRYVDTEEFVKNILLR